MTVAPLPSGSVPTPRPAVVRPLVTRHRSWQPREAGAHRPRYAQSALALTYSSTDRSQPAPSRVLEIVSSERPRRTRSATPVWAVTFVQAVVEVVASDRPMTQLVRWTTRSVYVDIARRREEAARGRDAVGPRSRPQVASVRVCQPESGRAEVTARLTFGSRSRAFAARLDFVNGRWLCTAICFG